MLFAIPSPVRFVRTLFTRTPTAEAPASPAPFTGEIVVVQPPPVALLAKPALVTPYAGHKPSVARGKGGRFESVKAAAPQSEATRAHLASFRTLLADPNHVWEL